MTATECLISNIRVHQDAPCIFWESVSRSRSTKICAILNTRLWPMVKHSLHGTGSVLTQVAPILNSIAILLPGAQDSVEGAAGRRHRVLGVVHRANQGTRETNGLMAVRGGEYIYERGVWGLLSDVVGVRDEHRGGRSRDGGLDHYLQQGSVCGVFLLLGRCSEAVHGFESKRWVSF